MVDADVYKVRIRFDRLFADPRIFDDPEALVRRYLAVSGLSPDKAVFIYQVTDDIIPVDDRGKPSVAAGFAKYRLEGKALRSEYMASANITVEYVDYGSGLSTQDHERLWQRGRWDDMRFEIKEVQHHHAKTELPEILQLYQMLKARADPTTMATVELSSVTKNLFRPTVSFLADRLQQYAEQDGGTVEVYAARDLNSEERHALERRLARESDEATVYVILSKNRIQPMISD